MTMSKSHTALATLALVSLAAAPVAAQEQYDEQTEQRNEPQVEELQHGAQQGHHDLDQGAVPSDQRQDQAAGMDQPGTAQPQGSATPGAASDVETTESDTQIRKREQRKQISARLRSESVQLSALDQGQIEELQRNLQEGDFYQGEIDGIVGPATRRALRQFYNAQAQLASAGFLLTRGAEALGMDQAEIERVKGEQEGQREPLRGTQAAPGAEQRQQPAQPGTQPERDRSRTRSTTPQQPGQNDLGQPPMNEQGEPMNPEPPMEDMDMGNPGAQP